MEQENERSGISSYQQNRESDLSATGASGRRDYLSEHQQEFQQSPQIGDGQQQSLRDIQQQEQRETEFTSPLTDQQESTESSLYGGDPSMASSRRGDISPEGERLDPYSSFTSPSASSVGEESNSYQETSGNEMNSFLKNQEHGGIENTAGIEESRYFPSSQLHSHRRHHKHHSSSGSNGDISDRELISKLLDMLRDKEHAKDVAQSESSFNYQHQPDSRYFMPEQNTFNPIQSQQQQQPEFPGTGRSSFPQNPQEFPSSSMSPSAFAARSSDSPEVPQAENLLTSLIQNLERSNSAPYSPPVTTDQQSFYQQPSPQSFFQQHDESPSFPSSEGFGRQTFQQPSAPFPSSPVIQNTFTQFQPQQQPSSSGLSSLLGGVNGG